MFLISKKTQNFEKELNDLVKSNDIPFPSLYIALYAVLLTLVGVCLVYIASSIVSVLICYIAIYGFNITNVMSFQNYLLFASSLSIILNLIGFIIMCRLIPALTMKLTIKMIQKYHTKIENN